MIVFELKNAIARLKIKIAAIELAAMPQPPSERLLRHLGIENLAFDVVDGGVLRAHRTGKIQGQSGRRQNRSHHDFSRHVLSPKELDTNVPRGINNILGG